MSRNLFKNLSFNRELSVDQCSNFLESDSLTGSDQVLTTRWNCTRRDHRVAVARFIADVAFRHLLTVVVVWLFGATVAVSAAHGQASSGPEVLKPGTRFRDCTECPEMVIVPAGTYMMGSPFAGGRAL